MKSMFVDWTRTDIYEDWDFVGSSLIRQRAEEQKEDLENKGKSEEAEQIYPDDLANDNMPMMNFAYPLFCSDVPDTKIIEVCERTNCTVIYNNSDDKYYLALTGGGMDLSQDIALAYMIFDGCIDWDLLEDVYISSPLSVGKKDYQIILKEVKRQLAVSIDTKTNRLEQVKNFLGESNSE